MSQNAEKMKFVPRVKAAAADWVVGKTELLSSRAGTANMKNNMPRTNEEGLAHILLVVL